MKLSIIIPYFNAKPYTDELLDCLAPQITEDVEVILVDDGSKEPYESKYDWCKVYRKENGGCSTARNKGLDKATGEYISFIDADDLVAEYFVRKLFEKFDDKPDIIEFSWKSLSTEGTQFDKKLNSEKDRLTNPSVCTRVFRREFIGNVRFNEKKDSTEDEDFSRKIGYLSDGEFKRTVITDYMYFYRTAVTDSKIKRFKKGLMNTKRIVYYYDEVTSDMRWLLDEIKKTDEENEVWLITNKNEIHELKRYCQISKPINIWGHEQRGQPYNRFTLIKPPLRTQVIIYSEYMNVVGGLATFIYNTCQILKDYYDIIVLHDHFPEEQVERLSTVVQVLKNDGREIVCDTLILNRITDKIPSNVHYKKSIQMCHACKQKILKLENHCDYLVNVSQASKDSWGEASKDGIVINNMAYSDGNKSLLLVSATRIGASDKGDNEKRMKQLAEMMESEHIPYIWLNFSDKPLNDMPRRFINMPYVIDAQPYIAKADYLIQLSNQEAFSYSILEALTNQTAVVCTDFASCHESGVIDGVNGYIVPFDMDFDVKKLLTVPKFDFVYDNEKRIDQWKQLLGKCKPRTQKTEELKTKVVVLKNYYDIQLETKLKKNTVLEMDYDRAKELREKKLVRIL